MEVNEIFIAVDAGISALMKICLLYHMLNATSVVRFVRQFFPVLSKSNA